MPKKTEDFPQVSIANDDVTVDKKVNLAENATNPEENLIIELETCEGEFKCNTNGGQESDSQQSCNLASATSVQHFKNVVAIVDPPRVGLHPTVSSNLNFM